MIGFRMTNSGPITIKASVMKFGCVCITPALSSSFCVGLFDLAVGIVARFPKSRAAAEFHRRVIQGYSSFPYMIQYGPLYSYRAQCCTSVQVIRDNNMYNN